MFDCEWILNNNMHVEAWHNILKTHIMERKNNVRIATLMKILRSAEVMFYWKWLRMNSGIREHFDTRWLAMRGDKSKADLGRKPTRSSLDDPLPECVTVWAPSTEHESRSQDYKARTMAFLEESMSLLSTKDVPPERLKLVMKQQHAICNMLHNLPDALTQQNTTSNVRVQVEKSVPATGTSSGNPTIPTFQSVRKKTATRTMAPLTSPKYAHKKKNKYANVKTVKALRNPDNRSNLATSFRLSAVGWNGVTTPKTFPETSESKLVLTVRKTGRRMSLGGIIFYPVVGGMLVPDVEHGFECLHMRVSKVHKESAAYFKGVTSQHYLHKLRVLHKGTRQQQDTTQVIGSTCYRNHYTNTIQLEKLAKWVDTILSSGALHRGSEKCEIEVTLLAYV